VIPLNSYGDLLVEGVQVSWGSLANPGCFVILLEIRRCAQNGDRLSHGSIVSWQMDPDL